MVIHLPFLIIKIYRKPKSPKNIIRQLKLNELEEQRREQEIKYYQHFGGM